MASENQPSGSVRYRDLPSEYRLSDETGTDDMALVVRSASSGPELRARIEGAPGAVVRLRAISRYLSELSRTVTPEKLSIVAGVDSVVESEVKILLRAIPKDLTELVRDSLLESVEAARGDEADEKLDALAAFIRNAAYDPRNLEEASEAISSMAAAITRVPSVRQISTAALEGLERLGVLGESRLSDLVSFFAALGYVGSVVAQVVRGDEVYLVVGQPGIGRKGDVSVAATISRDKLGLWAATIQVPNPLIPRAALVFQLTGHVEPGLFPGAEERIRQGSRLRLESPVQVKTQGGRVTISPYADLGTGPSAHRARKEAGVNVTAVFGADLPAAQVKVQQWSLPYHDVLFEQPALVLKPTNATARRWVRHDPLPEAVLCSDPVVVLSRMVSVRVDPGVEHVGDLAAVVAANLMALREAVGEEFFSEAVAPLTVRFRPERADAAIYLGMSGEIHVFSHPSSPHFTLHELAHHIDRMLSPTQDPGERGFSSVDPISPLGMFCRHAADLSRPHIEKVASNFVDAYLDHTLQVAPILREKLRAGEQVRLVEAVKVDGMFEGDEAVRVARVVARPDAWEAGLLRRSALTAALGHPPDKRQKGFVTALGLLTDISQDLPLEARRLSLRTALRAKLSEVMSPPEIFARCFHQVVRLSAAERGAPFGLMTVSWDLPDGVIRMLRPLLLRAMMEEDAVDLAASPPRIARQVRRDSGVSFPALLAAFGAAAWALSR